jgi:ribosomal protein S18 acetylase RimI-like enzyme
LVCRDDERARAWVGSFEVALDPAFQGQGAGRAAVEALARELYRWGKVEAILIGVLEGNARALRLYESLGYREVERVWWDIRGGRVRVLMLSDKPDRFTRRRVGFA